MQAAYNWEFDQTEDDLIITFEFPPTFNTSCVQINLLEDHQTINVYIDGMNPLFWGRLFAKATSFDQKVTESEIVLTIHKEEKGKSWDVPISRFDDNGMVDAKSGFLLFAILSSNPENEQMMNIASQLLLSSAQVGYVPSIYQLACYCLANEDSAIDGLRLLNKIVERYEDPTSMAHLGSIYLTQKETYDTGVELIKKSAEQGADLGRLNLGILLSPASKVEYANKDAQKAIEMFNQIEHEKFKPMGLYETAKLYYFGKGVEKNEELANQYYSQAKQFDPNVPPLESLEDVTKVAQTVQQQPKKNEESADWGIRIGVGLAVVATIASVVFTVFNRVRK